MDQHVIRELQKKIGESVAEVISWLGLPAEANR